VNFLLTTVPGLEDVVSAEVAEKISGGLSGDPVSTIPLGFDGCLRVETEDVDGLLGLDTIHEVIEIRHQAEAASLEEVSRIVAGVEFPELDEAKSFRVTSAHEGEHPFTRVDLQRAAGAEIWRRYGTRVDLKEFDVEIRVDLYGRHLVIGIPRTRRSLGKRIDRARSLRSALKPTIAAALLRLSGAHLGDGRLVDPLCGIGTIPIEAERINPRLDVSASDWDPETVEAARETVSRHGFEIPVRLFDARGLGEEHPATFDYIVTDPPYGVRQSRRGGLTRLYGSLLPAFEAALKPTGVLALIVVKYRLFRSVLENTGLKIVHEQTVRTGGLSPRLLVLAGPDPDPVLYARTTHDATGVTF